MAKSRKSFLGKKLLETCGSKLKEPERSKPRTDFPRQREMYVATVRKGKIRSCLA
jgi:hypothetical protein